MSKFEAEIEQAAQKLAESASVLFVTGAGISADSGVPTYRGVGGLYNVDTTADGMPIEELLSGETMEKQPELTWKYLHEIASACKGARFNRGHKVIAEIEKKFPRVWTLTQNVDGFHRDAGGKNVIEIHGNLSELKCTLCDFREMVADLDGLADLPLCAKCESVLRPDVVLFGELLSLENIELLQTELDKGFDLVFSIGTSSLFPYIMEPVWRAKQQGAPTIEINPDETEVSGIVDLKVPTGAAEALDRIWATYLEISDAP